MLGKSFSRWFFLHLIISIGVVAALSSVAVSYQKQATEKAVVQAKIHLADKISSLGERLQSVIATRSEIVKSMAHIIESDPAISSVKYAKIAALLTRDSPSFHYIAAAPDLVIQYIYPENGNKSGLGLDYRKNPTQLAEARNLKNISGTAIAGPVDLIQGGEAFIIQHPVYVRDPMTSHEKFWGVVSGAINVESIYAEIAPSTLGSDVQISVMALQNDGSPGNVFLGSTDTFTGDAVEQEVKFPNSSWLIAAKPANGWPRYSKSRQTTLMFFAISCFFSLLLINYSLFLLKKRIEIDTILKNAIEAIPSGFALYDKNDRLAIINAKFRESYKTSADIIKIGASFEEILRAAVVRGQFPEAAGHEEEWIKARIDIHHAANGSIEQKTDDGHWIIAEERRTNEGGTVGIRTDITELKEAKDAAEEANRLKSEFLNVMSHELRTPLTVILGYTPLLASLDVLPKFRAMRTSLNDMREHHPDHVVAVEAVMKEIAGFASTMDKNGKHLLSLINNILDLSKIEAGKMTLHKEIVESDEVMQSVVEQLLPIATKKKITLKASLGHAQVLAEKTRLKQILINLIGNAVKFTNTGCVCVETSHKGDFLEFRIADTGPGIPDQYKDKIFNQFTQVDGSDEREFGGTGLGLAISEKLVKLHGGEIGFTSTPGKGTVFWFTMPMEIGKQQAA